MGYLVIGRPASHVLNVDEIEAVFDSEFSPDTVIVRMKSGMELPLIRTTVTRILERIREAQS